MANWTPPPSPQQGPDPRNGAAQPGDHDPFAPQQPEYSDHTSLGTPLMQPGAGTPPPFVPPQPQPGGQFPGGQPFPGQGPSPFAPPGQYGQPEQFGQPGPYGQPGWPMQPGALHRPRKGMNPLLIVIGALAVLVAAGALVAVTVVGGSKEKPRTVAATSAAVDTPPAAPPTFSAPPVPDTSSTPTPSPSSVETAKQVPGNVLRATMKTAYGTTFRRVGKASGPCGKAAPSALKKTLVKHPCIGDFRGAVYSDAEKKAVVTVVVMPLKDAAAVSAVKRSGSYPYLINPDEGSGARSIGGKRVSTWSRVYEQDNLIVFSMAYRSDLARKDAGGVAATAAQHIGAEVTSLLIWS